MTQNVTPPIPKAPQPMYEPPTQVSARAAYYRNTVTKMQADSHYTAIAAKLTSAEGKIQDYEDAIAEALSGGDGKVAARNVAEANCDIEMSYLLPDIYKVGNSNPMAATAHYESIGVSWKTRKGWEWDSIEARPGEISGSFNLFVTPPEGNFAVIWWYQSDPGLPEENWKIADFSHNAKGYIEGLKPGVYYYFRAKNSSSVTGKSDFTQVIKVMCV